MKIIILENPIINGEERFMETEYTKNYKRIIVDKLEELSKIQYDLAKKSILSKVEKEKRYITIKLEKSTYKFTTKTFEYVDEEIINELVSYFSSIYTEKKVLEELEHEKIVKKISEVKSLTKFNPSNSEISVELQCGGNNRFIYISSDMFDIHTYNLNL